MIIIINSLQLLPTACLLVSKICAVNVSPFGLKQLSMVPLWAIYLQEHVNERHGKHFFNMSRNYCTCLANILPSTCILQIMNMPLIFLVAYVNNTRKVYYCVIIMPEVEEPWNWCVQHLFVLPVICSHYNQIPVCVSIIIVHRMNFL